MKSDAEDDISADAEFDALVKELYDQTTSEEFVSFDNDIDACFRHISLHSTRASKIEGKFCNRNALTAFSTKKSFQKVTMK